MAKFDPIQMVWRGERQPTTLNPDSNLGQLLWYLLSIAPDKVIQLNADTQTTMTCGQMKHWIAAVALNLKAQGYGVGNLAVLACANSDYVLPLYLGCLTIGVAVNAVSTSFGAQELTLILKKVQPKLIFCDESNRSAVELAMQEAGIYVNQNFFVVGERAGQALSIHELLVPMMEVDNYEPEYLGDSSKLLALVLCSSGTSGPSKGVCISHAHLIAMNLASCDPGAGPILNYSQLFWLSGVVAALMSLFHLRVRIITTKPLNIGALINTIEKYAVEDFISAPVPMPALLNHPRFKIANFTSIKRWTLGGSFVSERIRKKLEYQLGEGKVRAIYGCSETGLISATDNPGVPGSVGALAANCEAKIVDQHGNKLGPGVHGELRIKCKYMFLGYLDDPQQTRNALDEEGFYKTADVAYFNETGYLFVVDRIMDIITQDGYQLFPSILESIIERIVGVSQVCVVGIPATDKAGELAAAAVVLVDGSTLSVKEITDAFNRRVHSYQRLQGGVYFVRDLPLSVSAKVLRRQLKTILIEKYLESRPNRNQQG